MEDKPWLRQGLRFGLALWLLASAGPYLIYYAVQPMPGYPVAKPIGFGLVEALVFGTILAAVYRKPA